MEHTTTAGYVLVQDRGQRRHTKVPAGSYIIRFTLENGELEDCQFCEEALVESFQCKDTEGPGWFEGIVLSS